MGEKINAQAEIKTLSGKLEDIEAIMTEITLRLGHMKQPQLEGEARDIRDRVKGLLQQLTTTTTDPPD